MKRDGRDDRIDELERENVKLRAENRALQALVESQAPTIAALERRIHEFSARLRELKARLGQHSGNSSRPPSTDPPGTKPPAPPHRTGRKRGGQPGHDKHERALVPRENVTRTHILKPPACRCCGMALHGEDPEPYRHQVVEVPKVQADVDEYQLHTLTCDDCGTSTRASLPVGVPAGQFGPRLQAIVALSSGAYKMSKREIEQMVEDFFGVPIALGSIANLEQATSAAVAVPVAEVAQAIQQQPVVHADETGWYERSKRAWLWGAFAGAMAFFAIRKSRGAKVAEELLGAAFAGILVSDRWSAYAWVDTARRQLCWAHLVRQFRGLEERGPDGERIGSSLELLTEAMFHMWHRVRDGTMSRTSFRERMERMRPHVVAWLEEGASSGIRGVAGRCREILALEPALWTFVFTEGVEPTSRVVTQRRRAHPAPRRPVAKTELRDG